MKFYFVESSTPIDIVPRWQTEDDTNNNYVIAEANDGRVYLVDHGEYASYDLSEDEADDWKYHVKFLREIIEDDGIEEMTRCVMHDTFSDIIRQHDYENLEEFREKRPNDTVHFICELQ